MKETTWKRLDYDRVKQLAADYAVSYLGKERIEQLAPLATLQSARRAMDETAEALGVLKTGASVPIPSLSGIETVLQLTGTGYVFTERDFANIGLFLHGCNQLQAYMAAKSRIAPHIAAFADSMYGLPQLKGEIERCIRSGRVDDAASRDLSKVRRKLAANAEKIKTRMDSLMAKYRTLLQEQLYSVRSDRYVLPIKKEHRKLVSGSVLDESASGQTVYIEPSELAHLQHETASLRAEEAREEAKVLAMLTGLVEEADYELKVNVETIGTYDFIFAKAKYALAINAGHVNLNDRGRIRLVGATHPLLGAGGVPLDFELGGRFDTLIVTGPNTGGKTIALKTVGLLTLMANSGLLVPAGEESDLSIFATVAADIGDGQSIEQSLSTFSAHIRNMVDILQTADRSTLVLLDEMASGTDPGEGVGLSIAILEQLHALGAKVVATTHFNEIKHFAARTRGFENARMEFDAETLQPLYRLRIGEAGQSYAFQIATKLGLSPAIISRSQELTAGLARESGPDDKRSGSLLSYAESGESGEAYCGAAAKSEGKPAGEREEDRDERTETNKFGARSVPSDESGREGATKKPEPGTRKPEVPVHRLEVGDSVFISYLNQTGIVYATEDKRGMVGVMIQKQKCQINKKRLALHIPKKELYPDDYDLDIVFETKQNRKLKKLMSRKHVEGISIIKEPD